MVTKVINIEDESKYTQALLESCELLNKGKVVALPTETVYGLAANAFDKEAVESIYVLKERPSDNPLILHVGKIEQVLELIDSKYCELVKKINTAFWPGPLTIVVPKSNKVPDWLTRGLSTVAIRIPESNIMRDISLTLNAPLAAPSANTSGRPSPTRALHVMQDFDSKIDLVIDNGPTNFGLESTVIDISNMDNLCLLRPGAISLEDVILRLGMNIGIQTYVTGIAKSPGLKYKHYSPNCEVVLITYESEIDLKEKTKNANLFGKFIVVKNSNLNLDFDNYVNYNDISDLTKNIFNIFRTNEDNFEKIVVLYPAQEKKAAVYNRLQKAAGM